MMTKLICLFALISLNVSSSDFYTYLKNLNFNYPILNLSQGSIEVIGTDHEQYDINELLQLKFTKTIYFNASINAYDYRLDQFESINEELEFEFYIFDFEGSLSELRLEDIDEDKLISLKKIQLPNIDGRYSSYIDFDFFFDDINAVYENIKILIKFSELDERRIINSGYFFGVVDLKNDIQDLRPLNTNIDAREVYASLNQLSFGFDRLESEHLLTSQSENSSIFFNELVSSEYRETEMLFGSGEEICRFYFEEVQNIRNQNNSLLQFRNLLGDRINQPLLERCLMNQSEMITVTEINLINEIDRDSIELVDTSTQSFYFDANFMLYRQTRIAEETQTVMHNGIVLEAGGTVPLLETASAKYKFEYERTESQRNMDSFGANEFISIRQRKRLIVEKIELSFKARVQNCQLIRMEFEAESGYHQSQIKSDDMLKSCHLGHQETVSESWYFIREISEGDEFLVDETYRGDRVIRIIRGDRQFNEFSNLLRNGLSTIVASEIPTHSDFNSYMDQISSNAGLIRFHPFSDGQIPGIIDSYQ